MQVDYIHFKVAVPILTQKPGLRHMFHLRELRADDNQITQLDEIMHLDGLCSLSVKKNKLKAIDFEKASL